MKKAVFLLTVLLLFCLPASTFAGGYVNLTVFEAKAMIDSNSSLVILDVRTLSEYDSGHIRNAKNIPVTELESRLDELNVNSEILVYCGVGGRSATASQLLVDNGFLHVYNMLGGITAWTDAGFPVYVKYPSIQGAINMTHAGGTLFISSGLYYEHLTIDKPLKLVGENVETTILDGEDSGTLMRVNSSGVSISDFSIRRCGCPCEGNGGIRVEPGNQNVNITCNYVSQNIGYGISIEGCQNIMLVQNTITTSHYGIMLHNSTSLTITDNTVSNNTNFGFYISFSNNNTISGNKANDNVYALGLFYSNNNTIYHNNFVNNSPQIYVYDSTNIWDNGCEGNFWSNYNGTDLDNDGVGDTNTPWENVDVYPLMNLYWNPGDIDHDLDVDIFDVVRTASAYSCTPSDPNWNPHCDIAEPYEIISIYDVVVIASNYGEEYNT